MPVPRMRFARRRHPRSVTPQRDRGRVQETAARDDDLASSHLARAATAHLFVVAARVDLAESLVAVLTSLALSASRLLSADSSLADEVIRHLVAAGGVEAGVT